MEVLVLEGLRGSDIRGGGGGRANRAFVGRDGTLLYLPGSGAPDDRTMVWVDRAGNEEALDAPPRAYLEPKLSPDGGRILVTVDGDILLHDVARSTQLPLVTHPRLDQRGLWTPDGREVFFASDRDRDIGVFDIFRIAAPGAGQAELFYADPDRSLSASSWSADGQTLLVTGPDPTGPNGFDIGTVLMSGEGERRWMPLFEPHNEFYPAISPAGGRWLAYNSDEAGQRGVYVQTFPDLEGGKWPVSPGYQHEAAWARDGTELFYRSARDGGQMMVVSVASEPPSPVGVPQRLFEDVYFHHDIGRQFDVAPDGRFLMLKRGADSPVPREITVVRNWVDQLRERAPAN